MISEVESLYTRLDKLRMTPADRELAKARLAQAEAFAALLHAALERLGRVVRGGDHGPRRPGLHPTA